ncbi:MAG: N-acetylmuramoyl-L-alanine amidase [Rhodospirillaceae bacterium]|nr:N-acetylmuramoyl-L-alanine amidase [Rhodospirillaceae bacterium]
MRERPSPNFDERPPGQAVDILLLHYTEMESAAAALERLCDPAAKVSAHYLIAADGTVWRLVEEGRRAWHAGLASWAGARDINARSIGIELDNPGHALGLAPFPEPQMAALERLARNILARHPIPRHRVLGHSDVAPARKRDPGELFEWRRLAAAGIGLWPAAPDPSPAAPTPAEVRALLAHFGYEIGSGGPDALDETTRLALVAFQRHFRPARVDGRADAETTDLLRAVAAAVPPP